MKRLIYSLSAAALVLAACSKEEAGIVPQYEPSWTLSLRGVAEEPMSKVSIGTPDDEGDIPFLWSAGDKLGLYVFNGTEVTSNNNYYALLDKESGDWQGSNIGIFKATLISLEASTEYTVRIYYPQNGDAGKGGAVIAHRIQPVQTQRSGGVSGHVGLSGGFAYATSSFTTPEDITDFKPSLDFELQHKTAYIWLNLYAADSALEGWKVTSVRLSAPEGVNLSGETSFNTTSGAFSLTSGTNEVTVNLAEPALLSTVSRNIAYMTVFPTDVSGKNLVLTYTLVNADASQVKVVSHTRKIPEGMEAFAPGSVNRFTEKIPSGSATGWVYSTDAIDLSAAGTANCYIVSAQGSYSFDATVIGNGQKGILTNMSAWNSGVANFPHTTAEITPSSAEIIWQTKPGLITDVALSSGKVTFTKPDSKEGNALLCVKDASGKILWSWHIWCTDAPAVQVYESWNTAQDGDRYTLLPGFSYNMMDRNLGAVRASSTLLTDQEEADETIGLYYNGGRKDPFVGPEHLASGSALATIYDKDGNTYTRKAAVKDADEGTSILWSVENPDVFIFGNYWYNSAKWQAGCNLWGYQASNTNWGGYQLTYYLSNPPHKTIYDPCPPGYCVPEFNVLGAMETPGVTVSTKNDMGVLMPISQGKFSVWYPLCGYFSNSTGDLANICNRSYLWTNTRRYGYVNVMGSWYLTNKVVSGVSQNLRPNYGFNLRCMQEY